MFDLVNILRLVFSRPGVFEDKCNQESVDLERVVEQDDVTWLRDTLTDFQQRTQSQVAKDILDSWQQEVKYFVKVSSPQFCFL